MENHQCVDGEGRGALSVVLRTCFPLAAVLVPGRWILGDLVLFIRAYDHPGGRESILWSGDRR